MSDLPVSWTTVRLAEVTSPRGEKAVPHGLAMPFIGLEEVEAQTGRIIAQRSTIGLKSAVALFQKGDLLYGRLRPYLNKVVLADESGAASAEFIVFPQSKIVDQRYLQHTLMSKDFVAFTGTRSTGDRPRVSFEGIADYELPLPPIAEQQRIVAAIDNLSAKSTRARDRLDHIPRLVEKYKRAILAAAVEGVLTREWRNKRESDVRWEDTTPSDHFEWSSGKNLPVKHQAGGDVPVIGGNGVSGYHDEALIDFQTLVIGRVGAQCGNVHYSPGPAWVTDNAIYAQSISNNVDLGFAILFFRNADLNKLSGGSGQPYVNQSTLNSIPLTLPSLDEQHEIVRRAHWMMTWIDRLATETMQARQLIDRLDQAVLAKAFRGHLVPQEPDDEPARVLLERIASERSLANPKAVRRSRTRSVA